MPRNPNGKVMPDKDTIIWWIIRGLGGVANMLVALTDNDVQLDREQQAELTEAVANVQFAFNVLIPAEEPPIPDNPQG